MRTVRERLMVAGGALALAAAMTGCARPAPAPVSPDPAAQQQVMVLAYYNAALEQSLLRKEAELQQAKNAGDYVEKLQALVAVNDELLERIETAEKALAVALKAEDTPEEDRFAFAKELDDIRVRRAQDIARNERIRHSVQELQRLIDTGVLRVLMDGDRPRLVMPRPLDGEGLDDPWASR